MKRLLLLFFLLSGCASTDSGTSSNEVAAVKNGEEIICVREAQVGSHFSRRICRTKAEMEEARREAADLLDRTRVTEDTATAVE